MASMHFYMLFVLGQLAICNSLQYKVAFFTQVVDHFNYNTNLIFQQRYLYSAEYWKAGGPIVVYTGNEGDIDGFWNSAGFAFEIAKELNGYIVFIEHRYYGKSLPFGNSSFDHDKIGYLSVEQAIADYAIILQDIKKKVGISSPVIALGGSYGGMLSAYIRFKYPNVVDGSLASSAPIYLVAGLSNNHSFWEIITDDFAAANKQCPDRVRAAFVELQTFRKSGAAGLQKISEKFKLCKSLKSDEQVDHLIGWIRNAFAMMSMGDYPYPTTFFGKLPAYPVKVAAGLIINAVDPLDGLVSATGLFYNGTEGTLTCFDPFTEYIACADPTGCGLGPNSLAWDYQVCTEFLLSSGTNNVTDMFAPLPWTLDMRDAYCKKTWGLTPRHGWFKIALWGKSISSASNIIFSNGALDPWKAGGVPTSISKTLVAMLIEGSAHHLDLRHANPKDPESVVTARKNEIMYLKSWISQEKVENKVN